MLDEGENFGDPVLVLRRLIAIALVFAFATVAWMILGGTLWSRTQDRSGHLGSRVQSIWGAPQTQTAPTGTYRVPQTEETEVEEGGKKKRISKVIHVAHAATLVRTRANAALDLEHRRKGLLWYSTYKVKFAGEYDFVNPDLEPRDVEICFALPVAQAIYDDLQVALDGAPVTPIVHEQHVLVSKRVAPGARVRLRLSYASQGLDTWRYSFGENVKQIRDFELALTTNFADFDFPDNTLAPSSKRQFASGWRLDWKYSNLLSGYQIALTMPEKLQPGPLASEISFFAPVSLFFFFFLMFIITTLRNIDLHPMNYFFLAAAFFAFHLLLAYTVDHIDIHAAFAAAAAVSIFLVTTYLRLVVGSQFAFREAALAQFVYLVLFSYAFFFKGFTGLAVTIGAIVTLFVVMQATGRIRWSERFAPAASLLG